MRLVGRAVGRKDAREPSARQSALAAGVFTEGGEWEMRTGGRRGPNEADPVNQIIDQGARDPIVGVGKHSARGERIEGILPWRG